MGEVTAPLGITVGVAGVVHGATVMVPTALDNFLKFEPIEERPGSSDRDANISDDDLVSPNEAGKELRKNSDADKVAQKAGYKGAEDFKADAAPSGKGSDWNMMHNEKTGEIFLRRLSDGKIVRTYESTQ